MKVFLNVKLGIGGIREIEFFCADFSTFVWWWEQTTSPNRKHCRFLQQLRQSELIPKTGCRYSEESLFLLA